MVYGKLLYGGARRFRILPGKMARRTGERTAIASASSVADGVEENVKSWLQFGGPERNYEAVDMGTFVSLLICLFVCLVVSEWMNE